VQRSAHYVKAKENEKLVVGSPNAIVNPRAMVIHAHDAALTNRTVMRSRRFKVLAFAANRVVRLQLRAALVKVDRQRFLGHRPRIREHGPKMRNVRQRDERVEHDEIDPGRPRLVSQEGNEQRQVGRVRRVPQEQPGDDGADPAATVVLAPDVSALGRAAGNAG